MIIENSTFHPVKRNHSNAIPRYIISLHCDVHRTIADPSGCRENRTFRHATAMTTRMRGTMPTDIRCYELDHQEHVWELILKFTGKRHTTWIIAHDALSQFILSDIPERYERGECSVDWPRHTRTKADGSTITVKSDPLIIIQSPPTIIAMQCTKTQGRFVIVDLQNWLKSSIEDLGTACGLPEIKEPATDANDKDWRIYSRRQCEITFRSFLSLVDWAKEHDTGMFRYTAASQSMAAFRHRFMTQKIYVHDNEAVRKLERSSYFGGRLIVNKLGPINQRVHQLDINSLFPAVMKFYQYPMALVRSEQNEKYVTKIPDICWESSICEVKLQTEKNDYPVRSATGSVYPTGIIRTTLAGPELARAFASGNIIETRSWAEYDCRPLFGKYVDYFWDLRQEYKQAGKVLYEQFCKLMLNSLYGKFGQMSADWVNIQNDMSALPWSRWIDRTTEPGVTTEFRSFGWQIQRKVKRREIDGTFIAIPAFVTSYARCLMDRLRGIAGEKQWFYQAMDSLLVTDLGLERLVSTGEVQQHELGKLRLVFSADHANIHGNNDYEIGCKIKIAGVNIIDNTPDGQHLATRRSLSKDLLFCKEAAKSTADETVSWNRVHKWMYGTSDDEGWTRPYQVDMSKLHSPVDLTYSDMNVNKTESTAAL